MPSQIVHLPEPTLATLLDDHGWTLARAFGARDLRPIETRMDGRAVLRVHIDPLVHCPDLRDHVVDDIYAVLLTSGRPGSSSPSPVPLGESLTHYVLDEVEAALQDVTTLSGHEHIAIAHAFHQARHAQRPCRVPRQRLPSRGYESTLLTQAVRIQEIVSPAMPRLDRRLESYRAALQASGLPAAVARLGLQAELGLRLRLERSTHPFVPRLFGKTRRCGLEGLLRTTFNQLDTFQKMVGAIHDASANDVNWLQAATLDYLHAGLLANLPGCEKAGRSRNREMRVRSPFDGHITVLEVPGPEVDAASAELANAFDAALWRELHPIIRAALAHMEFVRVHPYTDGNGRLARLLMQGLLHEAGIPLLPLEALLAWNRTAYLDLTARAVQRGDILGFVHFIFRMIDQAIAVGRHMVGILRPHCQQIRQSLLALGLSGRLALVAAEHAVSMIVGPDPQLIERTLHGVESCWYLDESHQFEPIDARFLNMTVGGYDCTTAYSSPVARSLLATPLIQL
jgi:hypothetical protein